MKIGLTIAALPGATDYTNSYTLAAISAWIKRTMPDVEVIYSQELDTLLGCDEVWCTATSDAWDLVNKLGREVTLAGKRFLVGGHHATALPETLRYGVAHQGPLETYSHPDELPLPDWSIFPDRKRPLVITSRGCPYNCNFCSSSQFWRGYKARSPQKVLEELQMQAAAGAKEIVIFDDLFVADKSRLRTIAESVARVGLDRIEYSCLVRANLIDQQTVDLLRLMNVRHLAFGAESGSDRMLTLMNKRATVADNQRAIDILAANGYKPTISLIAGYPGETLEDLRLTRQFIERNRCKCNIIDVYPCMPFPGTRLWNWFVQARHIDVHHFDWQSLNLNRQTLDWDRYNLLTDQYSKQHLIEMISWNETEKLKAAA